MNADEILKTILKDPESDQLRTDYANVCADVDPDRAKFIRQQIEARNLMRSGLDSTAASMSARDLLSKPAHKQVWAGPVGDRVGWYDFGRGFVEDIKIDAAAFLQAGEELYALAPIRRLYLRNVAPVAQSLFNSPLLDRVVFLGIDFQKFTDENVAILAASPHLKNLKGLGLERNPITQVGLEHLMRSDRLPALLHVDLFGCPVYKTDLGQEYGDDQGHIVDVFDGLWPIERRLGRKTWLHTVLDHGLGYTLPAAY